MSELRSIRFVKRPPVPGRKTSVWHVKSEESNGDLGAIVWYGAWHKYVFLPTLYVATVYEQDCLRDIADFVEARTKEHKVASAAAKAEATR